MEGPSLVLAKEQLRPFKGKVVLEVSGNTKIGKERFAGLTVRDIYSWGKHLVFQFEDVALRIHFMLFGTFTANVDGTWVTGDYRKARVPRLAFTFENGKFESYNCSIKLFETRRLKSTYDFSIDIMSRAWDPEQAFRTVRNQPEEQIADVLLDQAVFAGVGNIIKNEVLSLVHVHPETQVGSIRPKKLREIIDQARQYSKQFYRWRKVFALRKNLKIHRKGKCPFCDGKITRRKTGKRMRWAYFCGACQPFVKIESKRPIRASKRAMARSA
jgi:endonuclease-8